jgi:RNA polymerase sigma-70 factor (ECF subfamily)
VLSTEHQADPEATKRASFEREALAHLDAVYRAALRLSGNPADADDLVQDTMLRAYQAWDQFNRGTNAKGWLLTIMRHAFISEYRRRATRRETTDVDTIAPLRTFDGLQDADPEGTFFDRLVDDDVQRAIAELPSAYREVLELIVVEDLRYEDTARILALPVGTIKSRLFRARKMLQARLYDYAVSAGVIKRGAPSAVLQDVG